jgi:hypothetical protein
MAALAFRIAQLTHDLEKKISIVTIVWNDESGRRLGLTVPFGTELKNVHEHAEAAVKRHVNEVGFMTVDPTGLEKCLKANAFS